MSRTITTELDDGVLTLGLNDPLRSNPLDPEVTADLLQALRQHDAAGAVVLRAEGRNFCSGGDHRLLASLTKEEISRYATDLIALMAKLASLDIPSVAGLHGAVVGGGVELALQCDVLVGAEDTWLHLPQTGLGGRIGEHTLRTLLARTSLSFTRKMSLFGRRISADEALDVGLLDEVCSGNMLEARAVEVARELADAPTSAMQQVRTSLTDLVGAHTSLNEQVRQRTS